MELRGEEGGAVRIFRLHKHAEHLHQDSLGFGWGADETHRQIPVIGEDGVADTSYYKRVSQLFCTILFWICCCLSRWVGSLLQVLSYARKQIQGLIICVEPLGVTSRVFNFLLY